MRGQRIPFVLAASIVLAFGTGGCGGGEKPTEKPAEKRTEMPKGPLAGADLARAADAVCRKHAAPHPATSTKVAFDTFAELKRPYTADASRAQAAVRELKALDVAPAARADLKNLYDTIALIGVFDNLITQKRSVAEFGVLAPRVVRLYEASLKYAAKLGSQDCPPKPESPAYLVAVERRGGTATTTAATEAETTTTTATESGPPPAPPDSTSVRGRWSGIVTQYGPGTQSGRYRVELEITSTQIGDDAGTDEYPKYGCTGQLVVRDANADGSVVTVRERIVKGRKQCFDVDAQIRLERVSADAVSFRWRGKTAQGRSAEVLGRLRSAGG